MLMYTARLIAVTRRFNISTAATTSNSDNMPSKTLEEHVNFIIILMKLEACQDEIIPERPDLRGSQGGNIRRLSIAVELVSVPDVLIVEVSTEC